MADLSKAIMDLIDQTRSVVTKEGRTATDFYNLTHQTQVAMDSLLEKVLKEGASLKDVTRVNDKQLGLIRDLESKIKVSDGELAKALDGVKYIVSTYNDMFNASMRKNERSRKEDTKKEAIAVAETNKELSSIDDKITDGNRADAKQRAIDTRRHRETITTLNAIKRGIFLLGVSGGGGGGGGSDTPNIEIDIDKPGRKPSKPGTGPVKPTSVTKPSVPGKAGLLSRVGSLLGFGAAGAAGVAGAAALGSSTPTPTVTAPTTAPVKPTVTAPTTAPIKPTVATTAASGAGRTALSAAGRAALPVGLALGMADGAINPESYFRDPKESYGIGERIIAGVGSLANSVIDTIPDLYNLNMQAANLVDDQLGTVFGLKPGDLLRNNLIVQGVGRIGNLIGLGGREDGTLGSLSGRIASGVNEQSVGHAFANLIDKPTATLGNMFSSAVDNLGSLIHNNTSFDKFKLGLYSRSAQDYTKPDEAVSPISRLTDAIEKQTKATKDLDKTMEESEELSFLSNVASSVGGMFESFSSSIRNAANAAGNGVSNAAAYAGRVASELLGIRPAAAATMPPTPTSGANSGLRLGSLSQIYEAGSSSGGYNTIARENTGGYAYGIAQLNSKQGSLREFLQFVNSNPEYKNVADTLNAAGPMDSPGFQQAWRQLSSDPAFQQAQHYFKDNLISKPGLAQAAKMGFDTSNRAIAEAIISTRVQHGQGGMTSVLEKVRAKLGSNNNPVDVINAIYDERTRPDSADPNKLAYFSRADSAGVRTRLDQRERYDALDMLVGNQIGSSGRKPGTGQSADYYRQQYAQQQQSAGKPTESGAPSAPPPPPGTTLPPGATPPAVAPGTPGVTNPIKQNSAFGIRNLNGKTRMHEGLDFAVPIGTPVTAASAGTVAGEVSGYGKAIYVAKDGGGENRYGHLSSIDVKKGDRVEAGQVIAKSGNTGDSTGPHLHFESRDTGGKPVDPNLDYGRIGEDGKKVSTGDINTRLFATLNRTTQETPLTPPSASAKPPVSDTSQAPIAPKVNGAVAPPTSIADQRATAQNFDNLGAKVNAAAAAKNSAPPKPPTPVNNAMSAQPSLDSIPTEIGDMRIFSTHRS